MKAKNTLTGETITLRLTTEHSAAPHQCPTLVGEGGETIDTFSWLDYEILQATDEELGDLRAAGYLSAYHVAL